MRLRRQALEPEQTPLDEIHERRIAAARACRAWQELDAADLVPRGGGRFLVAASDDAVYTPHSGVIWNGDRIEYGHGAKLHFAVQDGGDVQVLERYSRSWSEIVRQQASAR